MVDGPVSVEASAVEEVFWKEHRDVFADADTGCHKCEEGALMIRDCPSALGVEKGRKGSGQGWKWIPTREGR